MLIFHVAMLECRVSRGVPPVEASLHRTERQGECLACQATPVLGDLEG